MGPNAVWAGNGHGHGHGNGNGNGNGNGHGHGHGHGHGNGHGHGHCNGHGHHDDGPGYKGSSTLELIAVGPNLGRCGGAPNVELVFEGTGIDTAGGITSIESSACQDPTTGEVFDLVAVDTYPNGDSLTIVSDTFFFVLDPETCVATNEEPVDFDVGDGTGAFAGVFGSGQYHIAINEPSCNGLVSPAYVWFDGELSS